MVLMIAIPAAAQEFTTYKGHGGPVMGLTVAPDGQIASASFDNSVGLWSGSEPVWLEGHDAAVTAIATLPDGSVVSGGDDFAVLHWTPSGAVKIGAHRGKVTTLAPSPDGAGVVSGSWDGDIIYWPLSDGAPTTLPYAGAGVNAVAYSADGTALFAATSKGAILRYDMATGDTPRPLVKGGFGINRLTLGEAWLAYGAVDGGTRIIDAETGNQIADFTLDRRPVLSMTYHAETAQLAVGDGEGFIMVIDTEQMRIARDFRAMRQGPVWALAFSPDGTVIYAGGLDDVIYAWPVELLDTYAPTEGDARTFLRSADSMTNGERQFLRKCSICHSLDPGPSRRAGPTLHGLFGRSAGTLPNYRYSKTLDQSDIVWSDTTIDALFDEGPDNYIPGSKMPMQVIAGPQDRSDLIDFLRQATTEN